LAAGIDGFGSGGTVLEVVLEVVLVLDVDVDVLDVVDVVDVVDVAVVVVAVVVVVVVDAGGGTDSVSAAERSAQPAAITSAQVIRATDRLLTPATIGSEPDRLPAPDDWLREVAGQWSSVRGDAPADACASPFGLGNPVTAPQ
jgi:hypothetical protein